MSKSKSTKDSPFWSEAHNPSPRNETDKFLEMEAIKEAMVRFDTLDQEEMLIMAEDLQAKVETGETLSEPELELWEKLKERGILGELEQKENKGASDQDKLASLYDKMREMDIEEEERKATEALIAKLENDIKDLTETDAEKGIDKLNKAKARANSVFSDYGESHGHRGKKPPLAKENKLTIRKPD